MNDESARPKPSVRIKQSTDEPHIIYYSKQQSPDHFPECKIIKCGHPKIASWLGWFLAKIAGSKFIDLNRKKK